MKLFERIIKLKSSREDVWEMLCHTERLNQEIGLPPIEFSYTPRQIGGSEAFADIIMAGIHFKYREHPFNWVRPDFYNVCRTFIGGPIREIVGGTELKSLPDGGTEVRIWAEITAANAIGELAAVVVGNKSVTDCAIAARNIDAYLRQASKNPFPHNTTAYPVDKTRLSVLQIKLAEVSGDPTIAKRLADFVRNGDPDAMNHIRPYALADEWGLDRKDVLRLCLLAAKTGMLELQWKLLCPSCRGAKSTFQNLDGVRANVHCPSCNIDYGVTFDKNVEVCFRVAPSIRNVPDATYCVGGPGLSPHIIAQFYVQPGEVRDTKLTLAEGSFLLRSLQCDGQLEITVNDSESSTRTVVDFEISPGADRLHFTGSADTLSLNTLMTLTNKSLEAVVVTLESLAWRGDCVTAAEVTSLQMFRDQFGSQVLSAGTEIAVEHICILFSDLKGSTAMYQEHGDATSYQLVRDHFDLMKGIISTHDGAVVKTIGDAIMATFIDPAEGLRAAIEIQLAMIEEKSSLIVKMGLHHGPAIAVRANDLLDYFGHSVNLAARMQRESQGGDVVISKQMADDPHTASMVKNYRAVPFTTTVRGVTDPVDVTRILVT
ncbi:MAG: DUF5939 domain-containing protein [Chthonomonadales bacterium]